MPAKNPATKAGKAMTKKAVPSPRASCGKKAAPTKAATAKKSQVGKAYQCKVCGLVVSVIEDCGCVEACDLICCQQPMNPKRIKAA
jgi:hypothetical protein